MIKEILYMWYDKDYVSKIDEQMARVILINKYKIMSTYFVLREVGKVSTK